MLSVDIAVCTYGEEGLLRVEKILLPPVEGVRYVVSWQEHGGLSVPPTLSSRMDVSVYRLDERGLSNNRNNAIRHCASDLIIIADDDLVYDADALDEVRRRFETDPGLDIATMRISGIGKRYPEDGSPLSIPFPKGYYVSSVEIVLRRSRIGSLQFSPLLGLGAPEMQCGEEELFMVSALQSGLRGCHIGVDVCAHPGQTTGNKTTPGVLMGQGCMIGVMYPCSSLPRVLLKACRVSRGGRCSFLYALRHLLRGWSRRGSVRE